MKKFKAVKKVLKGGLLNTGEHLVSIESIIEDASSPSTNWADTTPQIKATMKNDDGVITRWFNMKGYQSLEDFPTGKAPKGFEFRSSEQGDENYLVNSKTNERVESEEKTALAEKIFCEFACDAGVEEGADFDENDLIEAELGVVVRDNGNGGVEVHYTKPASQVKEVADDLS